MTLPPSETVQRENFTVLLVEDNPTAVDRQMKAITQYINEMDFEPRVWLTKKRAEVGSMLAKETVDLVVTDMNIGEGFSGMDVVEMVKKSGFWTDILFYSVKSYDPAKVQKQIDYGFVQMIEGRNFVDELKLMVDKNIKRVGDILYLRGLVISRAIDLELEVNMLLGQYFKIPEKTIPFFHDFILGNSSISFGAKVRALELIVNKNNVFAKPKDREAFLTNLRKIMKQRDLLAHCRRDPANSDCLISMGERFEIKRKNIVETLTMVRTAFSDLGYLRTKLGLATA